MTSRAQGWLIGLAAVALTTSFGCGRDNGTTSAASNRAASNTAESPAGTNPDWWTTTKIQAKYFADSTVKGRNINVTTSDGTVTLTGNVASQTVKDRAEALAREVKGVTTVHDDLTVEPEGTSASKATGENGAVATSGHEANNAVDRGWITTKIQAQYFANPDIKPWNVDVTTASDGTVTLSGSVDSDAAKTKAETIARNTDGVTNVNDQLRIGSGGGTNEHAINEPDAWLTAKVQSKYYVNDLVKARDINVDTHDGIVTLNGTVQSNTERDEADALARSTPGVKDVKDDLTIAFTPASAHLNPVQHLPQPNRIGMDDWITTNIRSRLFMDPRVKNMNVDVQTHDRVVTLSGQVKDATAKSVAEKIASHIDGIKRVNDKLTIKQR